MSNSRTKSALLEAIELLELAEKELTPTIMALGVLGLGTEKLGRVRNAINEAKRELENESAFC